MILIEDTRNKLGKHKNIADYCARNGITIERKALTVGDYMLPNGTISVDTKQSILELVSDLYYDKKAFNKKYRKCLDNGIKLVVLIEQYVSSDYELSKWKSDKTRINGRQLIDMMNALRASYGVQFIFCRKSDTGKVLMAILRMCK